MKVELIQSCGTDLSVVNAARVSMDKESDWKDSHRKIYYRDEIVEGYYGLQDKDKKLIRYLHEHGHHSPFNHAFLTFRVKAPIFVARQLVKHKFLPWNEVSRRYVDSEPEFYEPEQWRKRADDVKQGSSDETLVPFWRKDDPYKKAVNKSKDKYEELLLLGVCPEQARMVLPQSMYTEWMWSGTLGAFLDMLKLRLDPHTQAETREVAELIASEVKKLFPVSYEVCIND